MTENKSEYNNNWGGQGKYGSKAQKAEIREYSQEETAARTQEDNINPSDETETNNIGGGGSSGGAEDGGGAATPGAGASGKQ